MKACNNPKCKFHFEVEKSLLDSGYVSRPINLEPCYLYKEKEIPIKSGSSETVKLIAVYDLRFRPFIPKYYLCEECYKNLKEMHYANCD